MQNKPPQKKKKKKKKKDRADAEVNWDPIDQTVLANEQVDAEGRSWRSGAMVERRMLKQWYLRITHYAEELYAGLNTLNWPQNVLDMQQHWLGRSEGTSVCFDLADSDNMTPLTTTTATATGTGTTTNIATTLEVFTTRPETIFGVGFLAVAPRHPLVTSQLVPKERLEAVAAFTREATTGGTAFSKQRGSSGGSSSSSSSDKLGVYLGLNAFNPLTGDLVPVYAADYVLDGHGTGAVMGVPAHDERDWDFAGVHGLPRGPSILQQPNSSSGSGSCDNNSHSSSSNEQVTGLSAPYTAPVGVLTDACGSAFVGLEASEGARAVTSALAMQEKGGSVVNWRLRDWLVSRQRYWGTPIPIVHCDNCGEVGVPESELPVELPPESEVDFGASGSSASPLTTASNWVNTTCPCCGSPARRETDTMDTFVDSAWYWLRYLDSKNDEAPCAQKAAAMGLPVNLYVGGIEHAVLHLLYARFFGHFIHQELSLGTQPEPFDALLTQGMVHGQTYRSPDTNAVLRPEELIVATTTSPKTTPATASASASAPGTTVPAATPAAASITARTTTTTTTRQPYKVIAEAATGKPALVSWEKMSKSKHNGVLPADTLREFGVDVTRVFVLFKAPPDAVLEWDDKQIQGVARWMQRLWSLGQDVAAAAGAAAVDNVGDSSYSSSSGGGGGGGGDGGGNGCSEGHNVVVATPAAESTDSDVTDLRRETHRTIERVTGVYERTRHFNVAVAELMKLSNGIRQHLDMQTDKAAATNDPYSSSSMAVVEATRALLIMLCPMAPHISAELWERLEGCAGALTGTVPHASVFEQTWPVAEADALVEETVSVVLQVGGKTRGKVDIPASSIGDVDAIFALALQTPTGQKWLADKPVKKIIVAPHGKLINVVVG